MRWDLLICCLPSLFFVQIFQLKITRTVFKNNPFRWVWQPPTSLWKIFLKKHHSFGTRYTTSAEGSMASRGSPVPLVLVVSPLAPWPILAPAIATDPWGWRLRQKILSLVKKNPHGPSPLVVRGSWSALLPGDFNHGNRSGSRSPSVHELRCWFDGYCIISIQFWCNIYGQL